MGKENAEKPNTNSLNDDFLALFEHAQFYKHDIWSEVR